MTNLSGTNLNNRNAVGPQGEGRDSPSSFPRYPKYKDSGVEWLGEVPDGWCNVPIKYMATEPGTIFIDGDWIERKDISSNGIRYITTGNIGEGIYKEQGDNYVTEETFNKLNCTEVLPGDVLISRLNNPIGRAAIIPELETKIVTSVDNVIFRPNMAFSKKYYVYLFSCAEYFKHTSDLARGTTMQRISRSLLGNIRVIVPAYDEQTTIATFLDHETAKIDTLITEQERLIALLAEKRKAVISHAVTKGLDPNVPMKDSGVEWLGEVPEHWGVVPLKHLADSIKAGPFGSALTKDMYVTDGYKVYGQEQVIPGDFTIGDYYVSDSRFAELTQYVVVPGDILISCVGTFGKIAVVPDNIMPGIINPRLIRLRPSKAVFSRYLTEVLRSQVVFEQFSLFSRGGTMDVINIGTLSGIIVSLPPTNEQRDILAFLDRETATIDELTTEARRAIDLLKERRSALISAAVTGKIDVRGLVDKEAAA